MAFIFCFEQLLFSKVGFTTSTTKAVKPTLLNKSFSNQKNKCHFVIPILKGSETKVQVFFSFEQLLFCRIDTPLEKAKLALG